MKLSYVEKIVFSLLSILSGVTNLLRSLVFLNPTCEFEGRYWKKKIEDMYMHRLEETSKGRIDAEKEYRERSDDLRNRQ